MYLDRVVRIGDTFLPTLILAVTYYLLNSMGVAVIVALQAQEKVLRVWRQNLLWGMTAYVACALGAVFVAAGVLSMAPLTAIGVLLAVAVVYISFKATVEMVPQRVPHAR